MKRNVVSVHATETISEAAQIIVKKHIGLLPVVDDDKKPVGVIGLRDLLLSPWMKIAACCALTR
jgi:CBS domain-containing protein